MSDIEIKDLPAPFFARYLEGQERGTLSRKQMQAVRGGTIVSSWDRSDHIDGGGGLADRIQERVREALGEAGVGPVDPPWGPFPTEPEYVTLAAPSDSDLVGE